MNIIVSDLSIYSGFFKSSHSHDTLTDSDPFWNYMFGCGTFADTSSLYVKVEDKVEGIIGNQIRDGLVTSIKKEMVNAKT